MRVTSDMPVMLVFPFELLSHYIRCLQMATAIRNDYDIYFVHSHRYAYLVEDAGFRTFPCAAFNPDEVMACARKFDFSWLNYAALERILRSQIESIQQYQPVAVLGDTAPTLKMAAEFCGVEYISLMNGYMTKYYKFVRQMSKDHPAAHFQNKFPRRIFELMIQYGEQAAFQKIHQPFKKLRHKFGLRPCSMYLAELEGDCNLICDLPELFPQKDLPENYHFIGPLFYCGNEPEADIRRFLENGKPSILANFGSSGDFEKFAFLSDPYFERYNIVIAGNTNGAISSEHVLCKPFINNNEILDAIDLVICHGGNGSIYQALAFGVPVVCATSIFEQEWNVQRVVELNLGASLDGITDLEEIRAVIQKWISMKNNSPLKSVKEKINIEVDKRRFQSIFTRYLLG
jgi:UDP:flavonoid glycosyltransferase YjiC (YdhE family)